MVYFLVGFVVGALLGAYAGHRVAYERASGWYRRALVKSAERLARKDHV